MSLYSFKDQLVRTSVRTITLQIFELKNDEMYKLFHVVPYCSFYSSLACHLRDLWISIEKEIDQITPTDEHHVEVVIKQVEDANETLFYLQDLFTVLQKNCPSMAKMLANALLNYAYLPVVVQSLCIFNTKSKPLLSISSCIYTL